MDPLIGKFCEFFFSFFVFFFTVEKVRAIEGSMSFFALVSIDKFLEFLQFGGKSVCDSWNTFDISSGRYWKKYFHFQESIMEVSRGFYFLSFFFYRDSSALISSE